MDCRGPAQWGKMPARLGRSGGLLRVKCRWDATGRIACPSPQVPVPNLYDKDSRRSE